MSDKDYLANRVVEEGDKLDYGIKGMKWGIRRSKAQLATASSTTTKSVDTPDHLSKSSGPETAAQRYSRLASAAKAGKGRQMSDEDLKFFNARTEALKKVEKLNESKPGWLKETARKVIQSSAEKQMQAIADAAANKYISSVLINKLNKEVPESIEEAIRKGAAERARKAAIEKGIERALGSKSKS